MDKFAAYTYGEARTGIGQLLEFSCPCDSKDEVAAFIREKIRTVDVPTTRRVNVPHGGYGQYSRYDIKQHDYAGGGPDEGGGWGFIEVLEIKDPPDGRCGIVINERGSHRGSFTEWETIDDAKGAFNARWGGNDTGNLFASLPGFKRRVLCNVLRPWFYAIGDEELVGDYAFPEGLQDDAVFRFGEKFVVTDADGLVSIKTCMGTRFFEKTDRDFYWRETTRRCRLVYWDDGTKWDESQTYKNTPPRPVEAGEEWIADAVRQFKEMLAGKRTDFRIDFLDGQYFSGTLKPSKRSDGTSAGDYLLEVRVEGEKPHEGWVNEFVPSPEHPTIIDYVTHRYKKAGKTVKRAEIKNCRVAKGGKKWAGVYHGSS